MFDWVSKQFSPPVQTWESLVFRLVAAAVFGLVVAAIYRGSRDAGRVSHSFPGTLVLLSVLIAMVTQVIGDNVALAFSLVGALSIVRFRTVVQDTKDTAFVIFAVAVGMAVGANQLAVALTGTVVVGLVAWMFREPGGRRRGRPGTRPFELDVRLGWSPAAESRLRNAIMGYDAEAEVVAGGTAKKGTLQALSYRLRLPRDTAISVVVAELRAIETVQSVELRRPGDHP